jgi:mannose-6-phosphate isomerase-like protein (cupin superfamily)
MKYVFPTTKLTRYQFPTHVNDLVIDRSESVASEVFVVVIEPGKAPPLHKHDDTEQVFHVIEGTGTLVIGREGATFPVKPGDVVRIPPATLHTIRADGGHTLRYLCVDCFPSGQPAAEPTWESHVKVLCQEQGWDFSNVKCGE